MISRNLNLFKNIRLIKGIETMFSKIKDVEFAKSFSNFQANTAFKNETSNDPSDFGFSQKSSSTSVRKKRSNYYETFINNTNSSFSAFFNPNVINQLIELSKLHKKLVDHQVLY